MGKRVVINGIVAKPELNGRADTAVGFDDDKGRYWVELDEVCPTFMIKPGNLFEQTKKQREDADRVMQENHQKNRHAERERKGESKGWQ